MTFIETPPRKKKLIQKTHTHIHTYTRIRKDTWYTEVARHPLSLCSQFAERGPSYTIHYTLYTKIYSRFPSEVGEADRLLEWPQDRQKLGIPLPLPLLPGVHGQGFFLSGLFDPYPNSRLKKTNKPLSQCERTNKQLRQRERTKGRVPDPKPAFTFSSNKSTFTSPCNVARVEKGTHTFPPWEDQCERHRMTRMTGPDCAVMCNLINTHTHTHTHTQQKIKTIDIVQSMK